LALEKSLLGEESFKDLFDNAHDLIQFVNLDGILIYANKSWSKTLGYEQHEIEGKSIFSFISEDDVEKYTNYRNSIIDGNVPESEIVVRYKTKDGNVLFLEGFISLRAISGNPEYLRGIFRDISNKLKNEAQLKERENNLQQLLSNAPDAIIVINPQSDIIFWNPAAEKLFGWKAEEVINKPLSGTIIPRQYREAHYNGVNRFMSTSQKHILNKTVEITAINKAGEEFYISLTISTTKLNGAVAFISFIRDIREKKKNEAELEKKRQQLEDSNKQLEQFAHVASHDIKEPVRKISIFTQRLENELGSSITNAARSYIEKINRSSNRLLRMIEGVLEYAKAGSVEGEFVTIDLNEIIRNVENDLEVLIEQKRAIIKYSNLPTIEGIDFLIYQLFYNLINNSLKFSKQGEYCLIEITAKKIILAEDESDKTGSGEQFFEIKVKDNGIGFEQEYAASIFKTFTRLHTRNEYDGTGLGLSLCENIMQRHNGIIKGEGEKGKGAIFTLLFLVSR
jgi:two-component system sensor kinase FixL